jgi:release factor glutamine methyltransferase
MAEVSISGADLWSWRQQAVRQLIDWATDSQAQSNYLQELDWLLIAVTDLDKLSLRLETFRSRPYIELTRSLPTLSQLWQQRLEQHVPIQYLLGQTTWRNLTLEVAPGVLIPRPETELLIDIAQNWVLQHPTLHPDSPMQWADLGTGSGAIALGLAQSFPQADIHAVDISPIALDIAQRNAKRIQGKIHGTTPIRFYQGEWLTPLDRFKGYLDGIISNPPYIPSAEIPNLQPEVFQHEPHLALDGGKDGLASMYRIVKQAPEYLQVGGLLLLEMMRGQAASVKEFLQSNGQYTNIQIHADLAGIERFVFATRI